MSNITDKFAIYKIIELLVNKTEAEKLTLVQMRANKSIGKKEYFEQLKKSVTEILLLTQKSLFSLSLKSGISYNSLYPTLKQPVTAKLNNLEPALPITSREDIATNAVAIIKDLKYDIEHLSVKMERLLNKDNKKINTTENQNKHWEKENMELAAPEKKSLERFILKKGEVKIVDDKPKKCLYLLQTN